MRFTKQNYKEFKKRNEILPLAKRNKISLVFVSRNKRNFTYFDNVPVEVDF
jgi:hypothetical protein